MSSTNDFANVAPSRKCYDCRHCLSWCQLGRAKCGKDRMYPEWTSINQAQWCSDFEPKGKKLWKT